MHVSEANRIVYLKKKARNQGTNFPGDAEGGLCGGALKNPVGSAESSRPSDGFLFSPGVCQHDERPPLRWDEQKQGCEIVELSQSFSNY